MKQIHIQINQSLMKEHNWNNKRHIESIKEKIKFIIKSHKEKELLKYI